MRWMYEIGYRIVSFVPCFGMHWANFQMIFPNNLLILDWKVKHQYIYFDVSFVWQKEVFKREWLSTRTTNRLELWVMWFVVGPESVFEWCTLATSLQLAHTRDFSLLIFMKHRPGHTAKLTQNIQTKHTDYSRSFEAPQLRLGLFYFDMQHHILISAHTPPPLPSNHHSPELTQ